MFAISDNTMQALEQARLQDFRQRLIHWLMAKAPEFGCLVPSPAQAGQASDVALELCLPQGILREGDVARVAMRALRHGPDFADRPEFSHVRAALAAQTVAPDRRVTLLKLIEIGHMPRTGPWHV